MNDYKDSKGKLEMQNDTLMQKKKMLITASTFPRWAEDTEPRFILDYAKAMNKYFDVTVLAPMAIDAKEEEVLEGVKIKRYHYFPIRKLETLCYPGAIVPRVKEKKIRALLIPFLFLSLRKTLNKISIEYDIVHAHWLIPQGIVQSGIKDTPYIVTGHGTDITSLNFFPVKQMKRKTLKRASYITVVSNELKNRVNELYPNNKTSIIPMGCDTKLFSSQNRVENYFEQHNKKVILFVGRLAEIKGVAYLIEAMRYIDDAVLVIVGKGNLEEQLREQAKEFGDKVIFLGAKTHEELPEIYASADVFVAPSITTDNGAKEGFGLVIIEAMASGTPVVASNSGGIRDIVTDGVNGLLIEEKDSKSIAKAIKIILEDNNLRQKVITQGLVTANKFGYENIAKEYHEIIKNIG